jgi:hypothetical protein
LPIAAAEDEASIEQRRNHRDTIGGREYLLRDPLIRSGLDFIEHNAGSFDASGSLGHGLRGRRLVISN